MVVDRKPRRGRLGLAGHDHAVRRPGETDWGPDERLTEDHRNAVILDRDEEPGTPVERMLGRHRQLVTGPGGRRPPAVDRDACDLESRQVEVEAAQALPRTRLDRRVTVEHVGCRVIAQVEVVMARVVAAVSRHREIGVARTRRPHRARAGLRSVRQAQRGDCGKRRESDRDRSNPTSTPKPLAHCFLPCAAGHATLSGLWAKSSRSEPSLALTAAIWRGGRVVECGGLENRFRPFWSDVGSNPPPPLESRICVARAVGRPAA